MSSLIGGMEEFRAAAVEAITALGHEAITAETLAADPSSPKIACLSGVREANLIVLIMGADYGSPQASGLSATHEEYREAKDRKPVLVFVQSDVPRDANQASFVTEVEEWEGGHFRRGFRTPDELRREVTQGIHRWELSTAVAPVDAAEMLSRAKALLSANEDRGYNRSDRLSLNLAISGGPAQQVLRPVEIEDPHLAKAILQQALFSDSPVFTTGEGSENSLANDRLVLSQEAGNSVSIDESGSVLIKLPLGSERGFGAIIEEDVSDKLKAAIKFSAWLLERIDASQKLSRVVLVAQITGSSYFAWRSRAEHERNPNSISHGTRFGSEENHPVHLQPPDRARAALNFEVDRLSEDLLTLLRRQVNR